MRETRITQLLAVCLIVAALSLSAVKWLVAGILPGKTISPLWHVEVRLGFRTTSPHTAVRLFLPRGTREQAVYERFDDDQLSRLSSGATSRNRSVQWRETKADVPHVLVYSAWIDKAQHRNGERVPTGPQLEKLRQSTKMIQADDASIKAQADALAPGSRSLERMRAVLEFVNDSIQTTDDHSAVSAVRCLKQREGSPRSKSRLVCALLRSRGIPCQIVGGVRLEEDVRSHAFYWVEAWDGYRWVTLCPTHGLVGRRPTNYLAMFRGDYSLAKFRHCEDSEVLVSVEQQLPPPQVQAQLVQHSPNVFDRLSLASLPPDSQQSVGLLLILPIGALLVASFRNLVGVSTFGIFMPMLLALAFRETHLLWGLLYLAALVGSGVLVRQGLNRLRLLMIPRLATVLTVIISMMIGLIFVGSRRGVHSAISVGLFPMVIMTTAVERFFVIQSEDSTLGALKESLTTALVATCTFVLFQWEWLRQVLFVYPELLLVVVGLLLLLGRYSGYRLMELRRFRWLAWGTPQVD
ncbi:MAG: hypothetical protein HY000_27490 [Planctomycetes bacterium]|nr:hypothetical protein [Planctomycetota bacterium]